MTTRIISRPTNIKVEAQEKVFSPLIAIAAAFCCIGLVLVFFFLTESHRDAREQFMEKLEKERQAMETNKALKTELVAITQKGYMEFAAKERLGLKKAGEQEVVVLR